MRLLNHRDWPSRKYYLRELMEPSLTPTLGSLVTKAVLCENIQTCGHGIIRHKNELTFCSKLAANRVVVNVSYIGTRFGLIGAHFYNK